MEILRKEKIVNDFDDEGRPSYTDIPITLSKDREIYFVDIDGVNWIETENRVHAIVLFEMLRDNVTEYVTYKKI